MQHFQNQFLSLLLVQVGSKATFCSYERFYRDYSLVIHIAIYYYIIITSKLKHSSRLQHLFRQGSFRVHIMHHRICHHRWNAQIFDCARQGSVFLIDDHYIQEIAIAARHPHSRYLHAKPAHQLISRPFNRGTSDNWTDSNYHTACLMKSIMDTWNSEDAADTHNRIARS